MTTRSEIRDWLGDVDEMSKSFSHMIVVCDSFDYQDYPIFVNRDENVQDVIDNYSSKSMQKVMEIYNYDKNIFEQLGADKSWNL